MFMTNAHAILSMVAVTVAVVPVARGQRVALVDEQVIREQPMTGSDVRQSARFRQLSPDGKTLLYTEEPAEGGEGRVQLVVRRLDSGAGAKAVEFRPDMGHFTLSDSLNLREIPFSPDGQVILLPDFSGPKPGSDGGEYRRPILACQTSTGRVARTKMVADARYLRIDATNQVLYLNGQGFSLDGTRLRSFGYKGIVEAANPRAPLLLVNTGTKDSPDEPNRIVIWNLRDDRLLATLPTNFNHPWTDDAHPQWTSDGTYAYFVDVVAVEQRDGHRNRIRYAKVWDAKAGKLVGEPVRAEMVLGPGPLPGTMYLRRRPAEGAELVLHHAESGSLAELPEQLEPYSTDLVGSKVAYEKADAGKKYLCVSTVKWDLPAERGRRPGKIPTTAPASR